MHQLLKNSIATSLILCAFQAGAGEGCSAKSGAYTVPLLELYSSEGCSSCPPADKWLNSLPKDASKLVPLVFHVDYWDYIGWKDRFAKPEYSERQRAAARKNGSGFVYTPQFMLNSRDFRGWGDARLQTVVAYYQKQPSRADLNLQTSLLSADKMALTASAKIVNSEESAYVAYVALYENKLSSKVNAGENNGSELQHNYVVRNLFGPYPASAQQLLSKEFTLSAEWKERDAGAVIFVQDTKSGDVIQSLQLPFCY